MGSKKTGDNRNDDGGRVVGSEASDQALVATQAPPRDYRFWLVFLSVAIATVLSALELVSISRLFQIDTLISS